MTAVAALVAISIVVTGEARPHTSGETASATLATQPDTPRVGEQTTLSFTLAGSSGEPLQDLMMHHGRKVHVVIVSEDMQVLGHIHPHDFDEPIEAGEAKVYFTFPRPGRYLVAADYMTAEGPQAEQFTVEVAGSGDSAETGDGTEPPPSIGIVTLDADDRFTDPVVLEGAGEAGGYGVALQAPDRIEAGEPVTLTYRYTINGEPVTDLRPYLEAPLHLSVVSDDLGYSCTSMVRSPAKAMPGTAKTRITPTARTGMRPGTPMTAIMRIRGPKYSGRKSPRASAFLGRAHTICSARRRTGTRS